MTWFLPVLFTLVHAGQVNDQLARHGLRLPDDTAWSITKNVSADPRVQVLEIGNSSITIELRFLQGLTPYEFEQEAKTEYASILRAYKTALTPYAGTVSNKLACAPEFLPKDVRTEFAEGRVRILFGFASERKTFGVCSTDEAKMEFAFLATPLSGDRFVKLTAFRKKSDKRDLESWKRILASFKKVSSGGGASGGAKSKAN